MPTQLWTWNKEIVWEAISRATYYQFAQLEVDTTGISRWLFMGDTSSLLLDSPVELCRQLSEPRSHNIVLYWINITLDTEQDHQTPETSFLGLIILLQLFLPLSFSLVWLLKWLLLDWESDRKVKEPPSFSHLSPC